MRSSLLALVDRLRTERVVVKEKIVTKVETVEKIVERPAETPVPPPLPAVILFLCSYLMIHNPRLILRIVKGGGNTLHGSKVVNLRRKLS